jgi:FHS family L-fucose permease-like MFS transporter
MSLAMPGFNQKVSWWCLSLVISLFFMWGVANNLNDILVHQFKKSFVLSDFQSGLVQSAFYFGYFFCAVPAALVMQRFGYKVAILCGLVLYTLGALLFYPAAEVQIYSYFLLALFIIACGLAFLETSANPYICALGSPQTAQQRLNLAQAFNPLGAISGILIGQHFIFSGLEYSPEQLASFTQEQLRAFYHSEVLAVQSPYLVIAAVVALWFILVLLTGFPSTKIDEQRQQAQTEYAPRYRSLFAYRHFRWAAIAQFCYVGAQVGIWSFLIRYALQADSQLGEKMAANALTLSLLLFMIGRFLGAWLMSKIAGHTLMTYFAVVNVLLMLIAIFVVGHGGIGALILASFGMSIMFPTIFAMGVSDVGNHTSLAASVLVMAIIGGAILTALMGAISDHSHIRFAFWVPAVCFAIIAFFSVFRRVKHSTTHLG